MSEDLFQKALIVLTMMRQAVSDHMLPVFQNPEGLQVETKLDKTIITNVDRNVENFLMAQLREQFPEANIIGEECVTDDPSLMNLFKDERPLWIIDALDGTYSFAKGQPGWGILISYMEYGRPVMSITLDGVSDQHIIAIADYGVFLNTEKVMTKFEEKPLDQQNIVTWNNYYNPLFNQTLDKNAHHFNRVKKARSTGETTFIEACFLFLNGEMDILPSAISTPWDFLPLKLIMNELGGRVAKLVDSHDLSGDRLIQKQESCLVVRYAPQWEEIRDKLFDGLSSEEISDGLGLKS